MQDARDALAAGDASGALARLAGLDDGGALIPSLCGLAHLRLGDAYRASAALTRAVGAAPDAPTPRRLAARAFLLKADFAAAAQMLETALRLKPPPPPTALAELARCYCELGDPKRAENLTRKALIDAPEARPLQRALAQSLVKQGREREAVVVLRRLVATAPGDLDALGTLGRAQLVTGQPEAARDAFETLLRAAPESLVGLAGMAEALSAQGDLAGANGYVLRALAAAPERVDLQLLHARIAIAAGQMAAAETAAVHAIALEPTSVEALRLGITTSLWRRRFDQAARFAAALLTLAPGAPEAVAARALQGVLDKRAEQALADLAPAVEAHPDEPNLHLAAGCAHLVKRRAEAAVAHLIEVVKQLPDHPWAQGALDLAYEFGRRPRLDVASATEALLRAGALRDYEAFVAEGDDTTDILEPMGDAPAPRAAPASPAAAPQLVEAAVNQVLLGGAAATTPPPAAPPAPLDPATGDSPRPSESNERPPPEILTEARWLRGLLHSDPELLPLARTVDRLIEDEATPLLLAVLGPSGAGKSTFVNALLGHVVIPHTTAVPYLLRYGRHAGARVVHQDGEVQVVSMAELKALSDEGLLTPEAVSRVELQAPIEELARARILDVPAQSDSSILLQADAVIWLGAVDQPMEHWIRAAEWLTRRPVAALAVCTQTDRAAQAEVDARLVAIAEALGDRAVETLALSAQRGLAALRARDIAGVRASGLSRLHRALARHFFDRSGALRGASISRQARVIAQAARRMIHARVADVQNREGRVQATAERIELERVALQRYVEVDAAMRLSSGLHEALSTCGPELKAIRDRAADHFTRLHQLDALRARVRRAVGAAVDGARSEVDAKIQDLLENYSRRLEKLLPADNRDAPRVAALSGILDAYRMVALESVFGRHRAYLDGWIEQAPLEVLLDADGALGDDARGSVADMVEELRTRGLRLGSARQPRLEGFGGILFEALTGFVDETATELRVTRVDLTQRLVEPLDRYLEDRAR